jgi:hypothetical protein
MLVMLRPVSSDTVTRCNPIENRVAGWRSVRWSVFRQAPFQSDGVASGGSWAAHLVFLCEHSKCAWDLVAQLIYAFKLTWITWHFLFESFMRVYTIQQVGTFRKAAKALYDGDTLMYGCVIFRLRCRSKLTNVCRRSWSPEQNNPELAW